MDKKIFSYGEIMLRISPRDRAERIEHANAFKIEPGGSESNVALCLAELGKNTAFLSYVPTDTTIRSIILRYLRQHNVDTSHIVTKGERIGIYWTEHGVGPRAASVIYDREHSSFSSAHVSDFNWEAINKNAHWFHVSGITPALSKNSCDTILSILKKIDKRIRISIDLNYRHKLWKWVKEDERAKRAQKIIRTLCSGAYLLTGNETDFQDSFGFTVPRMHEIGSYRKIAETLFGTIKSLRYIAISLRISRSASVNEWSGMLFAKNKEKIDTFIGPRYELHDIVDRVGTGDSFTAGTIYGILTFGNDPQHIVDFATTLGALNHTVFGDASQFHVGDVEHTLQSKGLGRIQR